MAATPIRLSALFALAALALSPVPAAFAAGGEIADEPASTLELEYRLYAGGIPLGRVDLNARVRGDSYTAASTLETVGIANALWEARLEATSFGVLGTGDLTPASYDAFSTHAATDWKRQQVTLSYVDDVPTVTPNPPYTRPVEMADDDKRNTMDPVSALVFFVTSHEQNAAEPCGLAAPIFDGRRRYDISLDFVRNTDVNMDNGLYQGPVDICRLNYERVAGPRQRVFEGEDVPELQGWVTSLQSTADPARNYLLPLRLWVETDYGMIVALLESVHLDGTRITSID
jgi:hypothetical protein